MGVVNLPLDETEKHFIGEPKRCFLCGCEFHNYKQPFVYWSGSDDIMLYLHAECAKNLGLHLIGDAAVARERQRLVTYGKILVKA